MKQQNAKKQAAAKKKATKKNFVLAPSPFTEEEVKLRNVIEEGKQVCKIIARDETIPRIRVSWQGCMTAVNYAESPLIENPDHAVLASDKIPRFAQTGMNYQEYLVSGINPGGSRDLLGASPRRWFHPVPSALSSISGVLFSTACGPSKKRLTHDKAMTKPLPVNDQERMYRVGTVQEACEKDRVSYIKSLVYSDSAVFDAAFSRRLCATSVARACSGDITYGGNSEEVFLNAIRMAASQWALFYSLFSYLINFMSRHTKFLYVSETGFVRSVGVNNSLVLSKFKRDKPAPLHIAVTEILDAIAAFVRAVITNTPCALRPWLTVNIYNTEVKNIGIAIERLFIQVEASQVLRLIGRKVATNGTRLAWEVVFGKIMELRVFYKAAYAASRIARNLLKENNRRVVDVLSANTSMVGFSGYAMCALAYHALIDDGSLPSALAYCPINMELFVSVLARTITPNESACYFLHPYTCAMCFLDQQQMLIDGGIDVVSPKESYMSFFFNALGPDHMLTMEIMFAQGRADTEICRADSLRNLARGPTLDSEILGQQASLYAVNTMVFVRSNKLGFVDKDFTVLFLHKLMDGCIAKHVLYCKTINKKEWFPRVGYMSPKNDPPNHMKRTGMANRIIGLWRAHSARRKMIKSLKMWQALRVLDRFYRKKVLFPVRIARRVARRIQMENERIQMENERIHMERVCGAAVVLLRFFQSTRLRILVARRIVFRAECLAENKAREESLSISRKLRANRVVVSKLACVFVMVRTVARVAKEHVLCLAATRMQALVRGFFLRRTAKHIAALIRFQRIAKAHAEKSLRARQQKRDVVVATVKTDTVVVVPTRPNTVQPVTILRRPHRLSAEARYTGTVHKVANILAHLFSVGNLNSDKYLLARCAPDGTVLFETLLGFPSIAMFACVVGSPRKLLVDAASCVKGVVFCSEWGIGNRMWRDEYRRKCADYCTEQHFLALRYGFATSNLI